LEYQFIGEISMDNLNPLVSAPVNIKGISPYVPLDKNIWRLVE